MNAGRYVATSAEAEFEPGSRGRVLRNLLGVRLVRAMDEAESRALYDATQALIDQTEPDHRFTDEDICRMHRLWLGEIYEWAGQYRTVNIMKGDFMFAAANRISALMEALSAGPLRQYTPCRAADVAAQAEAFAVVHAELVLIHPFREGNGRCARILSTLMGLQAGLPPLDFSGIEGRGMRGYIAAIHAAHGGDYQPMQRVFKRLIAHTLRASAKTS